MQKHQIMGFFYHFLKKFQPHSTPAGRVEMPGGGQCLHTWNHTKKNRLTPKASKKLFKKRPMVGHPPICSFETDINIHTYKYIHIHTSMHMHIRILGYYLRSRRRIHVQKPFPGTSNSLGGKLRADVLPGRVEAGVEQHPGREKQGFV